MRTKLLSLGVLAGLLLLAATAQAQWTVKGPTEDSFIKIGFLFQGQAEWIDLNDTHAGRTIESRDVAQNLFVRRFRILMGGQINSKLSFFLETDSPNLGKYDTALQRKNDGGIYLQDFFATYAFADEFKIDFGLMLIPLSHNSEQSAATLLPIDYGPFSFVSDAKTTDFTQSRVGRDYGVQARGYVFDKHFEYRAGVYQGNRDLGKQDVYNAAGTKILKRNGGQEAQFRYAGRVVIHFLDPEDGFFYTGTTLGKKNIFSIGASADVQGNNYKAYAADLFWDQPIGDGNAITFQFDYIYLDGSSTKTFPGDPYFTLMAQNDYLAEFGYFNQAAKAGFYAQWAEQNFVQLQLQDEKRYQVGLVYWGLGHNFNVKAGYGVLYTERTHKKNHLYRDQYVVQCQVFMY